MQAFAATSPQNVQRMRNINNSLSAGTRLDKYTITKTLGGGGFSLVYLARDEETGEQVVIKEYLPGKMATRDRNGKVVAISADRSRAFQNGRMLFFQEASILSALKHPNIVDVKSFFRDNGTVYMIMAYEEGQNLQYYITKRGGRLSDRFLLTVFPPLLRGLKLIHDHGYLHLDIKPGNIHIRTGGNPILLDFGAVHRRMESRQWQTGQVTTSGFSPIEQYSKKGYVGPWTDIYAIGASMRACIEGKPPQDARKRQANDQLKPAVLQYRRQYPARLLEAIDWALELDPLLRPQSVDEFLEHLPALEERPAGRGRRFLDRLLGRRR